MIMFLYGYIYRFLFVEIVSTYYTFVITLQPNSSILEKLNTKKVWKKMYLFRKLVFFLDNRYISSF